jgi:hypothetical protein
MKLTHIVHIGFWGGIVAMGTAGHSHEAAEFRNTILGVLMLGGYIISAVLAPDFDQGVVDAAERKAKWEATFAADRAAATIEATIAAARVAVAAARANPDDAFAVLAADTAIAAARKARADIANRP